LQFPFHLAELALLELWFSLFGYPRCVNVGTVGKDRHVAVMAWCSAGGAVPSPGAARSASTAGRRGKGVSS